MYVCLSHMFVYSHIYMRLTLACVCVAGCVIATLCMCALLRCYVRVIGADPIAAQAWQH